MGRGGSLDKEKSENLYGLLLMQGAILLAVIGFKMLAIRKAREMIVKALLFPFLIELSHSLIYDNILIAVDRVFIVVILLVSKRTQI